MSIYRQGPAPAGTCPRCRETLIAHPDTNGIKTCAKCGGVFANNETSRRIVRSLDRVLLGIGFEASLGKRRIPDAHDLPVACPECLTTMQRARIESAACSIDACPTHGTWFDTGELQDVMRAYNRARDRGTLPPGLPRQTAGDIARMQAQREHERKSSPNVTIDAEAMKTGIANIIQDLKNLAD